ncbi:MAG: hypothetical protein PUD20_09480, partial [bacterium]|nr:hypothetical protein [bacterium]
LYVYDRTRENSMMNSSKGTFRLQDINAVSMDVEQEFNRVAMDQTEKSMYSIVHCLFMKDQYDGMAWAGKMRSLPEEVEKISEQNWYRTRTITVRDNQDTLNLIFGNIVARDIIVVARYCLHKNYYRYLLEMRLAHHCPILFDKYSLHSRL